jgi:hypothetical protein
MLAPIKFIGFSRYYTLTAPAQQSQALFRPPFSCQPFFLFLPTLLSHQPTLFLALTLLSRQPLLFPLFGF